MNSDPRLLYDVPMEPDTHRLLRLATYASVATALTLIVVKVAATAQTGSVSVLASLVDSLLDGFASLINLFAVRYALMPADNEHRFGHGKAEPLAGLAQVGFICMSAVFLLVRAVDRLLHPEPLRDMELGIGVMLFATVLTLCLVLFQRHVVKKTQSTAIRADSLHYVTDLLANVSVIAALVAAYYGWLWGDALVALLVALFIFYSAAHIGYDSLQQLMDREIGESEKKQVITVAESTAGVLGVHELRTRQSGQRTFIQMHLDLDESLSLREAHDIAEYVRLDVEELFPESEVIIHQDPVSTTSISSNNNSRSE